MTDSKWRKELEMLIEQNLNEIINETKEYDYAISKSKNKSKAQIWIALAILNHKIKLLETSKKDYTKKIPPQELNKILKTLENL